MYLTNLKRAILTFFENNFFPAKKSYFPEKNFDKWLISLNSLLDDIPTLEVSTTIVEEIIPEVFIPWEIYQDIYQISPVYLQELTTDPSLRDRYIELRRRMELQYALLVVNPDSKLYNAELEPEIRQDLPILAQSLTKWSELPLRLPSPETISNQPYQALHRRNQLTLDQLLQEPQFLITLQQLGRVKQILDHKVTAHQKITEKDLPHQALPKDITYAQTSISIEGKIQNRYSQEILKLDLQSQKNIIQLHNQAILAGEKQWHKLFIYALNILKN